MNFHGSLNYSTIIMMISLAVRRKFINETNSLAVGVWFHFIGKRFIGHSKKSYDLDRYNWFGKGQRFLSSWLAHSQPFSTKWIRRDWSLIRSPFCGDVHKWYELIPRRPIAVEILKSLRCGRVVLNATRDREGEKGKISTCRARWRGGWVASGLRGGSAASEQGE